MPQLVLEINGKERVLDPGRSYTVGRDPESDLVFDDASVSWQHATISFDGEVWELTESASDDGIFADGTKAPRVQLGPGVRVNLGDPEKGPLLACSSVQAEAKAPRKRAAAKRVAQPADGAAADGAAAEAAEAAKPAARKRAAAKKAAPAEAADGDAEAKPAAQKKTAASRAPRKKTPEPETVETEAAAEVAPEPVAKPVRRKAAAAKQAPEESPEPEVAESDHEPVAKPARRTAAAAKQVSEESPQPEAAVAEAVKPARRMTVAPEEGLEPEATDAEAEPEAVVKPARRKAAAAEHAPEAAVAESDSEPVAKPARRKAVAPDEAPTIAAADAEEPQASVAVESGDPVPPAPATIESSEPPVHAAPQEVHAPSKAPARPQPPAAPEQLADPERAATLQLQVSPGWSATGERRSEPTAVRSLTEGTRTTRIGRAEDNDIVVEDLQVSRYHAELRQLPDGGCEVVDLGSHNGVFLNGKRVQRRQLMGQQDRLTVGRSSFMLVDGGLHEYADNGAVTFSAQRLTVEAGSGKDRKILLDDVSFAVAEKSLVAVIGPSGCGKSTLLRALTGYRPADRGAVVYDGLNLYQHFAELRSRIGLVPQSEILHRELTVRKALGYAAELRFPGDTRHDERKHRINEVLHDLRLEERAGNRITALSGGQQKRVSVALELLTKPSLIFLDEPTSGLDPGMDREVMQTLRNLADDGRTVLVVTHSVAELALCDQLLVLAPGGRVAYFGPPSEALHFFGYESWADVFQAFENYPDYDWAGRYRDSVHYRMYSASAQEAAAEAEAVKHPPVVPPKPQSYGAQLWTLIRRYLSVIASDRGFMALSVLLPLVLGGVSLVIPDKGCGLAACANGYRNDYARLILLVVAFSACLSGSASSVRELIKERAVYERERATGLSRSAYLVSKIIVLGAVCVLQGVIISAVAFKPRTLPAQGQIFNSPVVEMAIGVVLLGFVSMMVGLAISALVETAEKTMPLLVMFAIVQMVFTGAIFQVFDKPGLEEAAWLMPARWGLAAIGNPLDLAHISPVVLVRPPEQPPVDNLWTHSVGFYLLNCVAMIAISVGLAFLVQRFQRRHEPEVMQKG